MGCHDRSFKTDLLILSSDLKIERVMAKGRLMVHEDEILDILGIQEKSRPRGDIAVGGETE